MIFTLFVMGPAGSGKSTFVASFSAWLESYEIPYLTVNLDPAAEYIPYVPDIDVREYITAREVMEKYRLGPNGAIVASVDLMLSFIPALKEEIQESASEGYVLFDTPGQMEIFAFRRTGVEIVKELVGERGGLLFIVDSALATSPSTFASQIFLASSVYYRFKLPQLNVFNKTDLLQELELRKMLDWVRDPDLLLSELEEEVGGEERLLVRGLLDAVKGFLESFSVYFISAKISKGLEDIYADLQKIYRGGEDFELPEYLKEPM